MPPVKVRDLLFRCALFRELVCAGVPPTSFVPPHVSVIGAPPAQSHTPPRPLPSSADPSPSLVATPTYTPAGVEVKPQASSTPVVSVAGTRVDSSMLSPVVKPALSIWSRGPLSLSILAVSDRMTVVVVGWNLNGPLLKCS